MNLTPIACVVAACIVWVIGFTCGRWFMQPDNPARSRSSSHPYRSAAVGEPSAEFIDSCNDLVVASRARGAVEERVSLLAIAQAVLSAANDGDKKQARAIVEAIEARGTS